MAYFTFVPLDMAGKNDKVIKIVDILSKEYIFRNICR